jgi:hypothetical protein
MRGLREGVVAECVNAHVLVRQLFVCGTEGISMGTQCSAELLVYQNPLLVYQHPLPPSFNSKFYGL